MAVRQPAQQLVADSERILHEVSYGSRWKHGGGQPGQQLCSCSITQLRLLLLCARLLLQQVFSWHACFHLGACSKDSTSVVACYLELADKVRTGLGHIDPYFQKLADGMVAWIQCWQTLNPEYEK